MVRGRSRKTACKRSSRQECGPSKWEALANVVGILQLVEPVQLAVRARDPFWHEVLYGTLIGLGAVRELLELDGRAPGVEAYLRSHGGLTGAVPGVPIGPLSSNQVCSTACGSA